MTSHEASPVAGVRCSARLGVGLRPQKGPYYATQELLHPVDVRELAGLAGAAPDGQADDLTAAEPEVQVRCGEWRLFGLGRKDRPGELIVGEEPPVAAAAKVDA